VDTVVTTTASRALSAPNDLAFGPDGCLYFTDPGGEYSPGSQPDPGYICVLRSNSSCEVLQETGRAYPNGIVVEPDGSIVWVESYTRAVRRRRTNSVVEDVCVLPEVGAPDGLAISSDGELYITATKAKGIDILGNDGTHKGFIPVDGIPTNCAFDGDVLYVTDGGGLGLSGQIELTGQLWAIKIAGARGMPLHRGQVG
jgi:gluconolactonase